MFTREARQHLSRGTSTLLVVALLAGPSPAWAAPPAAAPSTEQMAEARRRYDRALELTDEGNYDDALLELQRAYSLAPTYRLLYNLGVVSVAVHDYLKAIDYFNRYLGEGGAEIEASRVAEVQTQIARLKNRIATLTIQANVPGAEIALDDAPVGKAPLAKPLTVNAGRHRVTATLDGYLPATANVEVVGNDSKSVALVLSRPRAVAVEHAHPLPWVAYGITAALGAGTIVTGVLALDARSNYNDTVGTLGASADHISSSYRTMRAWSITSDALLGTTIIAAGVSVYLTIKGTTSPQRTGLRLLPDGFAF